MLAEVQTEDDIAQKVVARGTESTAIRQKAGLLKEQVPTLAIKTSEGPVVTGIVRTSASPTVARLTWSGSASAATG